MRGVNLFRSPAPVVLAVSLVLAACSSATPSLAPVSAPPSDAPVAASPRPTPVPARPTPTPTPTAHAGEEPATVDDSFYRDMPVNLEMTTTCGLCGPERWLLELPRFRLYADGLAVFRAESEDASTAPYRVVQLGEERHAQLVRYALDEGGLRGADARYPGNADDAGSVQFVLNAQFVDDDADVEVEVEPLIGGGTIDVYGNPIKDLDRRERLARLADLLSNFDAWAAARGAVSQPLAPQAHAAALVETIDDAGGAPWPWDDLEPADFARVDFGRAVARLTPEQAAHTGLEPGGGSLATHSIGSGRTGNVLVRPVLPGDDRPGMFGLRPDTVAVTVEPGLRVRSRPEVSEASVMYEPLLAEGDALYVISGPVEGSGYDWFEVHAPRTGHTGWVAAAGKTGEDWIVPTPLPCTLGASPDEIMGQLPYELMHLACFSGVEYGGTYRLAPFEDDGLQCPDVLEWVIEPEWLQGLLACAYRFGKDEPDTGGYDLPAGGVLHPSVSQAADRLIESHPDGLLVEVKGQLDHPDSRSCTPRGHAAPDVAFVRLICRMTFVITEMRAAD